jgi:ABC-2 type transport system permease protein
MTTIYILWLRQIKRYLRSRARIVGSLGQPILFLFALGFGLGPTYAAANGGNYIDFLAPGIIAMSVLFTAIFSGIEMIWDRQFGFLKETMVAPVSRLSIMFGRTLGGATVATLQGCIVFVIALIGGFHPVSWAMVPVAILFMFLIAFTFTALGTGIASILEDMQGFQLIMNFLVMPLFFLSGALFPIDNLPTFLAVVVRVNPLSYGVDALRATLIGTSHWPVWYSGSILIAVLAIFLLIGSWLFSRIEL